MKFLVILCLVVLSAAEEENQEDTQQVENPQPNKANPTTQSHQPFNNQPFNAQVFSQPSLNLENKDLVGGVPYTGFVGNFPPVQAVNPDLLTHVPGVVSGGVSNFPQVQKTAFPATYYTGKFSFPSFPNDLGVQYTGVPSRTLPGFQGYQGVATVKNLQTHQGNLGLPQLSGTSYNVFSQEPLTGFVPQGLNPQAVAVAPEPATVPAYTRNVLTQTPTTVFPTNQGVLKYPVTGVTHAAFNVPQLPTKNVPTDPSGRVFVRS